LFIIFINNHSLTQYVQYMDNPGGQQRFTTTATNVLMPLMPLMPVMLLSSAIVHDTVTFHLAKYSKVSAAVHRRTVYFDPILSGINE